jgi:uncharacterized LabA/DUF88 family protein
MRKKPIYAFIDASNLFYGGVKSLGWKIDYKRLLEYLKGKYQVRKAFYFAGVEIYEFPYSILKNQIDLEKLLIFLQKKLEQSKKHLSEKEVVLLKRNIQRTKFYLNLKIFGYILRLKPVKLYKDENGKITKKANCDVDMTFEIMRLINKYSGIVFLSGDGDFAPLLKYLLKKGKKVTVLARGERTAKEIRQIAKGSFRDFNYLREVLKFRSRK